MNPLNRLNAPISPSQATEQSNVISLKPPLNRQKILTSLFLERVSCFTGGNLVAQALYSSPNPMTSLTSIACIMIPLGCMFFLRETHKGLSSRLINKVDICSKWIFISGAINSAVLNYCSNFFHQLMCLDNTLTKICVFHGAFVLGYILYRRIFDLSPLTTFEKYLDADQASEDSIPEIPTDFNVGYLMPIIENLKKENENWKSNFEILNNFINKDQDMVDLFKSSGEKSKNILLKTYEMGKAESEDPVIAEWEKESYLKLYYEDLYDQFMGFLQKNPEFTRLLKEKLDYIGKNALLNKPTS